MKARWAKLAAKFDALKPREKQLVAAATIVVAIMGGYSFWVEPALLRAASLKKQIIQRKGEMQALQGQVAGLKSQLKDPDAANKAALAEVKRQLVVAERALQQYDKSLVPAERMPQLLQSLFTHHRGLELVSLQTLPPAPLLPPPAKPEGKAEGKAAEAKPDSKAAAPGGKGANILKHGIEIKMAGNYLDLLAYVAELEALPQKLFWGRMTLAVTVYPRSELSLTLYTLSPDAAWMVM